MTDPSPHPNTDDHAGVRPDRGSPPRVPRWAKVSAIIVAILVLLIVAVMLIGGGEHGPGRHTSSDGVSGQASLSGVTAGLTASSGWGPRTA